MAESYLGEIRLFAFDRIPIDWQSCDGRLLQISTYQALYSLLGVAYGGDGRTTFGLPDLRGRVPVSATTTQKTLPYGLGCSSGAETVTVTTSTMPAHNHNFNANSNEGTGISVRGAIYAAVPAAANAFLYAPFAQTPFPIDASMLANAGAGAAHNNMQPYLALSYAICTAGLYPTRP